MSLFESHKTYKPFKYPWAFEAWKEHEQLHWLPEEVPMADDIQDWRHKLSDSEKHLLEQIFRFFTQGDVEVGNNYHHYLISKFKPTEIVMMLSGFGARENVHIAAYSHLIDTLGMPESEYAAFLKYKAMKDKSDYLQQFSGDTDFDLLLNLATFGAFTEGLQLFASFAILLNFPRFGKMKGMGQIVTWSVRDETAHCEGVVKLFHTMLQEKPELNTPELRARIEQICREVVEHEDAFIDLAFEAGEVRGMTPNDIKQYIRFIADRRLIQLGYKGIFKVKENPLPWLDEMLNAVEHVNFFEQRGTEYSKAASQGTWDEVFSEMDTEETPAWTIYSKSQCPYCDMAKKVLKQQGIEYVEQNLDDDAVRQEFYAKTGARTVPQIYHRGVLVGGFQELRPYLTRLKTLQG